MYKPTLAIPKVIVLLGLLPCLSASVQAAPPPGTGQWTLTLNEDFNGTALNTSVWNTGARWDCILPGELQGYRPENVTVANGICSIKVEKKPGTRNKSMTGYECGTADYASGEIQTYNKWTQTYGYFEARVKMPNCAGTWPAFWLLPDRGAPYGVYYRTQVGNYVSHDGVSCPMGNEIDIFEYMGTWQNPTTGLSRSHSGYFWQGTSAAWSKYVMSNQLQSPNTQYHTYGLYWGPGILTWYIDGRAVLTRTDPATISVSPQYLILNCAVTTNDWTSTAVTTAQIDASLPGTMDIDYVKVYSGTAPGGDSGDIGAVGQAGGDSVDAGTGVYTLTASGADIGGTADAFHFKARPVTGDCTITARVDSLTNTNNLAKAGVMMREQIDDPGSPNIAMLIPALAQPSLQYRTTSGGATTSINLVDVTVDEGFTDGGRTNGTDSLDSSWLTIGTPSVTVADDSAGIGYGNALELTPTATGRGLVAGMPSRTLADGDSLTVFFDWRFTGTTALNQSKNLRFGLHSTNGTPTTADNTTETDNDKGYFVGTNPGLAASNGSVLHRENGTSAGVLGGNDWITFGTAGASISAGTTPHYATLTVTRVGSTLQVSSSIDNQPAASGTDSSPVTYTFDQFGLILAGATLPSPLRVDNVQVGYSSNSGPAAQPPGWVRITRVGNVFTGYYSTDGVTWTLGGSQTIAMPATIYVGMAATSHNNSSLTTAKFSNVALDPYLRGEDIGVVGVAGNDSVSGGTYTIQAGGTDISGTADSFRFVSQSLIGDGSITAKVNSIVRTDYAARAAVMIRTDDGPDANKPGAVSACMLVPNLARMGMVYRTASDTASGAISTTTTSNHPPMWLRLTRVGDLFTSYYSADGVTWTLMGSQTIVMPASVRIGLAVCSHNTSALTTAVIDNVTITGTRGL